ncbi:hypothetical protein [Bacteriovorax sp. Seq25_V]|uniref:hypothetical protein n=1 Tax=Bacteriovorax sp. Seq25_V TaxID=1201288 RepID=UPI000389E89E|nr:hypothetical protein [Bacteriovorax sp. Seq25_V]EQC47456.1 hypothetical protein M900_0673 [Bacteriovorax sp. Seq25_V]
MVDFNQKYIKVNQAYLANSIHQESLGVDDLINGQVPLNLLDQEIIDSMYVREIEKILNEETLYQISRAVINLENKLNKLEEIVNLDVVVPNLREFYTSLSAVFLQCFVETENIDDLDEAKSHWLEAVKIGLEEELSIWQEKIKSQKM